MRVRIYTDGGARGNPGPAAAGAVIKELHEDEEGETLAELSEYLGETTNNQAEYHAIIMGLKKALELGATEVEVYMDTELAQRQLIGTYKVKNEAIAQRFKEVHNLRIQFRHISFTHIPREKNSEADALVNKCIDEQKIASDEG